jgi:protein TonB
MKSNAIRFSALLVAIAAIAIQPAGAATGTAFTQNPFLVANQPPRAIAQPVPEYSTYLRHAEIQGNVVVSFEVSPKGDVVNPAVIRSTDRLFDEPTLRAIAKWKYVPAMKAGLPVSSRVNELVTFSITDAQR